MTSRIESDLRTLEKLHIKPVFVFSGLNVNKRQKTVNTIHVDACRDRKAAWDQYEGGMTSEATKLFQGRNPIIQWDLWRAVLRIFRHRNVEYMVAPYVAWAQVRFSLFFLLCSFGDFECASHGEALVPLATGFLA